MRQALSAFLLAASVSFFASAACTPQPVAECGPSNCDGCCTLEGACLPGLTATDCGGGGAACSVCIASQSCVAGSCALLVGDAGQDGGTGDGGVEDGGVEDGGTEDGGTTTTGPIAAPAETWTWVDFPEAVCGNGAATGLGVNLTSASTDVFIYMEGGGACWDTFTCFTFPTASNLSTGYSKDNFTSAPFKNAFAVNRTQAQNPFKDMSFVYIPYCTGDVHAGDALRTYGGNPEVHHKGAKNVDAFLARLVPTFPNATRVFVTGSSAGGYGAQLNYERFLAAFPSAEIHVLADSAQMITPNNDRLDAWLAAWNFTLPPGCMDCTTDFTLYPEYLATTYPDSRFAATAYTQDNTLRSFFGYDGPTFQQHTLDLLANRYDPYGNAHYYLLAGSQHTMLGSLGTLTSPGGTTLRSWMKDWVDGAAGWTDVKP